MARGFGVLEVEYLRLSIHEVNMDEKEEFLQMKMTEEIAVEDNWDRKHLIMELSSIESEQLLVEQGIERIRNIDRMLGTNTGLDRKRETILFIFVILIHVFLNVCMFGIYRGSSG